MKKFLFVLLVGVLSLSAVAAFADAGPITRMGVDYNGAANPGGCVIEADDVHPTELRVNCSHSDRAARVRYRELKNSGFIRGPATITADLHVIKGTCVMTWRNPIAKVPARTARVYVTAGSYCHIRSITATQP